MSNFFGQTQGDPFGGGGDFFGAPRNLTRPVTLTPGHQLGAPQSLEDTAMGQASQVLDRVRQRQLSWQDAREALKVLPETDRVSLAKLRGGNLTEDERRALNIGGGGDGGGLLGGLLHGAGHLFREGVDLSQNVAGRYLGVALPGFDVGGLSSQKGLVGDTARNASGDINTMVKDLPAGLYKAGRAAALDTAGLTQGQAPTNFLNDVLKPIGSNYADTYGGLNPFDFHPGRTAEAIQKHPLGPLFDALSIASAGVGLSGRLGLAAEKVAGTHFVEESPNVYRMGTVDRTTETYQPLGYSMDHYVRPTTQQIANEPWRNHFSFIHDP